MDKISTPLTTPTSLSSSGPRSRRGGVQRQSPSAQAMAFVKQFARAYNFESSLGGALGAFICN